MPTEISGSTGVNKIQDNTIVNADINSSAAIAGSKLVMPTGSVLQTVQFSGTASRTISTSTSAWVSHFSLAITPSSTSSKILIQATVPVLITGSSNMSRGGFRIERGSTTIWNTDDFREHFQYRNADGEGCTVINSIYLDSPNTTSATTYTWQGSMMTGDGLYMMSKAEGSNMVLMEIAG